MTAPSVCPSCGAAVRADSPWCTLCYADLRAAPEPAPEPAQPPPPPPIPAQAPAEATPAPAAAPKSENPTWPCTACGTQNSFDRDTCEKCGQGFLATARDTGPLLDLPVVGDITRFSRAQRLALVTGVVLLFVVLTVVIGIVLG